MSRTIRTKRPKMRLGRMKKYQYDDGSVRDGTPTHASKGCEHHGRCSYCLSNRTHRHKRRQLIEE